MPVLRIPTDTGLGDTLGNLGRSLSENLNPMNTIRAYDMQQQMFLRQQQLLQMQRENQARQAAIQMYAGIVPPDKLPGIALMIYQNAPQDQIMRQAAMWSDKLIDKTDPESIAHNIRFMESTGQKWTDPYPPYAGEVTGAYIRDLQAKQAGAVSGAQEGGKLAAGQANAAPYIAQLKDDASPAGIQNNIDVIERWEGKPYDYSTRGPPVKGPQTQAAFDNWKATQAGNVAAQTALGTKTGELAATQPYLAKLKDDPSPQGIQNNIDIIQQATGKPYDYKTLGPPVKGPLTQAAYDAWVVAQAKNKAAADEAGKESVTGVPATEPTIANPRAGPSPFQTPPNASPVVQQQPAPTAAAAAPAAPAATAYAPTPQGATPDPTHPGAYWTGGQYHAPIPTAGAVIGGSPADFDYAKNQSEGAQKDLTSAYAAGEGAIRLKTITSQIRALEQVSHTSGFVGQITAGPLRDILDKVGLENVTNAQQAQTAEMNLLKNELPNIIKSVGMTRVAQPELIAVGNMTGTADLPPGVLNNILANVDNGADLTLQRKTLAGRVLGFDPTSPMNYPEFQQQDAANLNNYSANADKLRTGYGAVGAPPPPAAPDQGSSPATPSIWDAVTHWLTGGNAAPSVELDPATGLPKAQ